MPAAGFSTPLSPLVETCASISEAALGTLPFLLGPVSFRGSRRPRQRGFFTGAALLARRSRPPGIHVEVTFKTKPRNGTIALLMSLTGLPATFGARHPGRPRSATGSKPLVGTLQGGRCGLWRGPLPIYSRKGRATAAREEGVPSRLLWLAGPKTDPNHDVVNVTAPQNLGRIGGPGWGRAWGSLARLAAPGARRITGRKGAYSPYPLLKCRAPGRSELPDSFIVVLVTAGRPGLDPVPAGHVGREGLRTLTVRWITQVVRSTATSPPKVT
jgi:hypothetical protein